MDWIYDRRCGPRVCVDLKYRDERVLLMENDALRVVCLPDRGANIVSFFNKRANCECLMHPFPILPTRKPDAPVVGDDFRRCLSSWPEMFPVASDYGDNLGQLQPLHGEARFQSWRCDIVEDSEDAVSVRLSAKMQLSPFVLTRTMTLEGNSGTLILDEEVKNVGSKALPILWGHHPTFGAPFIEEGVKLYLPDGEFIDGDQSMLTMGKPGCGDGNMFYRVNLAGGWYGLFNDKRKFGLGMRWDHNLFRVIWIWQSFNADSGSPMFDDLYGCAVEPVTSLPSQHERYGDLAAISVEAGQTITTRLEAFLFDDPEKLKLPIMELHRTDE